MRKTLRTGNGRNNEGVDDQGDRVPVRSPLPLRNGNSGRKGMKRPVCVRILSGELFFRADVVSECERPVVPLSPFVPLFGQ